MELVVHPVPPSDQPGSAFLDLRYCLGVGRRSPQRELGPGFQFPLGRHRGEFPFLDHHIRGADPFLEIPAIADLLS